MAVFVLERERRIYHGSSFAQVLAVLAFMTTVSCCTATRAVSPRSPEQLESEWQHFIATFGRRFTSSALELERKAVFAANLHEIDAHNQRNLTYRLGITQFTDLTPTLTPFFAD